MLGVSQQSCVETYPDKACVAVHIRLSQLLKEALLQAKACGVQATLRFGKDAQPNVRPDTPSCCHLLTLPMMSTTTLHVRASLIDILGYIMHHHTSLMRLLRCSACRDLSARRHGLQAIRVGDRVFEFTAHEESNCDLIRVPKDASASVLATDVGPITQRLYVKVRSASSCRNSARLAVTSAVPPWWVDVPVRTDALRPCYRHLQPVLSEGCRRCSDL